jgi:hypothetical protein
LDMKERRREGWQFVFNCMRISKSKS